jgi:hypothetical protein
MNGMTGPLERLWIDPVASAQAQAWLARLEARKRQEWPALRDQILVAAQRAESMRDTVIGRLNKESAST